MLPRLGVPGSAELTSRFPALEAQAREWSRRIGAKRTAQILDGPWKEWIVEANLRPGQAVNYGLRKDKAVPAAGTTQNVWQQPGHAHDAGYADYSQLWAPLRRKARRDGVEVDLLDVFAAGPSELGDRFPSWLVEEIR